MHDDVGCAKTRLKGMSRLSEFVMRLHLLFFRRRVREVVGERGGTRPGDCGCDG